MKPPMARKIDMAFQYTSSAATDLKAKFRKIIAAQKADAKRIAAQAAADEAEREAKLRTLRKGRG